MPWDPRIPIDEHAFFNIPNKTVELLIFFLFFGSHFDFIFGFQPKRFKILHKGLNVIYYFLCECMLNLFCGPYLL